MSSGQNILRLDSFQRRLLRDFKPYRGLHTTDRAREPQGEPGSPCAEPVEGHEPRAEHGLHLSSGYCNLFYYTSACSAGEKVIIIIIAKMNPKKLAACAIVIAL